MLSGQTLAIYMYFAGLLPAFVLIAFASDGIERDGWRKWLTILAVITWPVAIVIMLCAFAFDGAMEALEESWQVAQDMFDEFGAAGGNRTSQRPT